jgi:hypothetical protein
LHKTGENQSVLISGESGAGKTETAKHILNFIANASPKHGSGGKSALEERVLQANPLIESFGNSKTVKNSNSSRFGKLIRIGLDEQAGAITSGNLTNYLLEKSRVVHQANGERNYHVFYQLLSWLESEPARAAELKLVAASGGGGARATTSFSYLNQSNTQEIEGVDDAQQFREVVEAMNVLQFNSEERDSVVSIIAALLHVGDIKFESADAGDGEDDDVMGAALGEAVRVSRSAEVQGALESAAELLRVPAEGLSHVLTSRVMRAGIGKRASVKVIRYDTKQAREMCDALAKACYAHLFDWLIHKTNKALSSIGPQGRKEGTGLNASDLGRIAENANEDAVLKQGALSALQRSAASSAAGDDVTLDAVDSASEGYKGWIGILDIFGFEVFAFNSFEQLCINYCNQKLQCFFDAHVFRLEQQEYRSQGVENPPQMIAFNDCEPCLELIESRAMAGPGAGSSGSGPMTAGILAMIDEEVRVVSGTDSSLFRKLETAHRTHPNFKIVRGGATRSKRAMSDRMQKLTGADSRGSARSSTGTGAPPVDESAPAADIPDGVDPALSFTVVHFAGNVTYNASGFLTKNKDTLHPDIVAVLCKSESAFVRTLMQEDAPPTKGGFKRRSSVNSGGAGTKAKAAGRKGKGKGAITLGAKFRSQLDALMSLLGTTEPHFVRCIKPNAIASPTAVTAAMVLDQMRCSGLQQLCKVRQAGMPVRLEHADFVRRFGHLTSGTSDSSSDSSSLTRGTGDGSGEADERAACTALCKALEGRGVLSSSNKPASSSVWAMGTSKVFFSHAQMVRLNEHEDEVEQGVLVLQGQARALICRIRYRQRIAAIRALQGKLSASVSASAEEMKESVANILTDADENWPVMWGLVRHPTMALAREEMPRPFTEHEILLDLKDLMTDSVLISSSGSKGGTDADKMATRVASLEAALERAEALDPPMRHPLVTTAKRDLTRLRHLATLAQDLANIVSATADAGGGLIAGTENEFSHLQELLELADDVTGQAEGSTDGVQADPALARVVETARQRKGQFETAAAGILEAALAAQKSAKSAAAAFSQLRAAIDFVVAMGRPEQITGGSKYTQVKEAFDQLQGEFGASIAIGDALDLRTVTALDSALQEGQRALTVAKGTPGLKAAVEWATTLRDLVAREDELLERVAAILHMPDHLDLTDKIEKLTTAVGHDYPRIDADSQAIDGHCPADVAQVIQFARDHHVGAGGDGAAVVGGGVVDPLIARSAELQLAVESLELLKQYESTIKELGVAVAAYKSAADAPRVEQLLQEAGAAGVPASLTAGVREALGQLNRREELLSRAQKQVQQEIENSSGSVNADGEDELLVDTYAVTHAAEKVEAQRQEEGARMAHAAATLAEAAGLGYLPRLGPQDAGRRLGMLQVERREEMWLLEAVAARLELRLAIREASAEQKKGKGAALLESAVEKWGGVYDDGGDQPPDSMVGKGSNGGIRLPGLADAAVSAEQAMVKGAVAALKRARLVQTRLKRVAEVREKLVSTMLLAAGGSKSSPSASVEQVGEHSLVRLRALIVQAAAANAKSSRTNNAASAEAGSEAAEEAEELTDPAMRSVVETLLDSFQQKMRSEKVLDQLRGAVAARQIESLADAIAEADALSPPPMLTVEAMAARALLRDLTMEQVLCGHVWTCPLISSIMRLCVDVSMRLCV